MVHAAVGFAFTGTPENGGEGLKISLDRCMCARVALKQQRKSTRHDDGSLHYDGEVTREKGDIYQVAGNVTGTNQGTSTNPKYALRDLWEHRSVRHYDRTPVNIPKIVRVTLRPCPANDHPPPTFLVPDYFRESMHSRPLVCCSQTVQ